MKKIIYHLYKYIGLYVWLIGCLFLFSYVLFNASYNYQDIYAEFCQGDHVEGGRYSTVDYCDGKPFVCNYQSRNCYYVTTHESVEKE